MTQTETIKIMAMLSAYYGQGKSDAQIMAKAWHLILKDYPYTLAEKAVIEYAKNDTRDYAAFPAPGAIVRVIKAHEDEERKKANRIFGAMYDGIPYDEMPEDLKALCGRETYERGQALDDEELLARQDEFKEIIRNKQKRLTA